MYIIHYHKKIEDLKTIIDKVKIPHDAKYFKGLSYVVDHRIYDFIGDEQGSSDLTIYPPSDTILANGYYRFSIMSKHQFTILHNEVDDYKLGPELENKMDIQIKGINTIVIFNDGPDALLFILIPVDPTVVRATFRWILEYLSPL